MSKQDDEVSLKGLLGDDYSPTQPPYHDPLEEALLEASGQYRRMWRVMRGALLNEGVPGDLVDEVCASFLKMAAGASK